MLKIDNLIKRAFKSIFSRPIYCHSIKDFIKVYFTGTTTINSIQQKAIISFFMIEYITDFSRDTYLTDARSIR